MGGWAFETLAQDRGTGRWNQVPEVVPEGSGVSRKRPKPGMKPAGPVGRGSGPVPLGGWRDSGAVKALTWTVRGRSLAPRSATISCGISGKQPYRWCFTETFVPRKIGVGKRRRIRKHRR